MAMYFAPTYAVLFGLLALSSIGAGCIYPSAVRAMILWFPVTERATAIGVNQTAINASGILAAVTLPSIAERWGWQYGLLAVGVAGLAVTALVVVGYRSPRAGDAGDAGDAGAAGAGDGEPLRDDPGSGLAPARPPRGTFRRLLRHRDVRLLAAMGFFFGIVEYAVLAQLILYMTDDFLLSAVAAGGVLALAQAAGAVAKPVSGLVSDRLLGGRRRPLLIAMAALALVMCLVLALGDGELGWVVYPVVTLLGLAAVGWGGLFGTAAGEIGGRAAAGQVAGLTAAAVNVGIVIGPPAFGAIVDATGEYDLAWLAMAVSAALAIICIAFVREPREHDPATRVEFDEA